MYVLSSSFVIKILRRDNRGLTRDLNSSKKLVKKFIYVRCFRKKLKCKSKFPFIFFASYLEGI